MAAIAAALIAGCWVRIKVVVAAERDQAAAATLHPNPVEPLGLGQNAVEVVAVERRKLAGHIVVE
jgi:hypothetical protein